MFIIMAEKEQLRGESRQGMDIDSSSTTHLQKHVTLSQCSTLHLKLIFKLNSNQYKNGLQRNRYIIADLDQEISNLQDQTDIEKDILDHTEFDDELEQTLYYIK